MTRFMINKFITVLQKRKMYIIHTYNILYYHDNNNVYWSLIFLSNGSHIFFISLAAFVIMYQLIKNV